MRQALASLAGCFPREFEPEFYRSLYLDLESMTSSELRTHYEAHGIREGRRGSPGSDRAGFAALVPTDATILEIGPFCNPLVKGPNVRYFDVLGHDGLVARAQMLGLCADACPQIDYVSHDGHLSVIDDTFDVVLSCHAIEHQVDLLGHLIAVGTILNEGGYYFIVLPDKRYCFDHFLAESTIADVLNAHYRNDKMHSLKSVIEHRALTTHNNLSAHWRGEHGVPRLQSDGITTIRAAIKEYEAAAGAYIDVHAWQFTAPSFRQLFKQLFELSYSPLKPVRVYNPVCGTPEFCAILQKCPSCA